TVTLGPGLLKSIYDGIQRQLPELQKMQGDFILRGSTVPALDEKKKWKFTPTAKKGVHVSEGMVIGKVQETDTIEHKILVPPGFKGIVKDISEGAHTINDVVCHLDNGTEIKLAHKWPVRKPRPYAKKLRPDVPLVTGQRIIDTFFPIAKGGTAAIPGPFGSGKTVTQHQLAKWSDSEVIVYIGCGERGNEMTEVLEEFPHLIDPKTNKPLMERTVLIANTSNMPVAAREASIYTGMTIAEYYRDMGYNVSLTADSTSRWAEAMREISSRLEEMPGEEGYPAYLSAKLSQFYERAGRVACLGDEKRIGSVSAIGAVSPPGGDFSEPVTQNTLRVTKVFWALDARLANRRHFPSINWLNSYSLYLKSLEEWFAKNAGADFPKMGERASALLQKEAQLQEIVQLVGSDSLPEKDRVVLEVAKMLREGYLQQNAYHEIDAYCSIKKQAGTLKAILDYHDLSVAALDVGGQIEDVLNVKAKPKIIQLRYVKEKDFEAELKKINDEMGAEFKKMHKGEKKSSGEAFSSRAEREMLDRASPQKKSGVDEK
ncbi:TPA: V-type ATP synthase subunit A, partial [archaeon]|nr:V-type ATP synthase subunit A [Candidatus Naiadarchaeales archaeon SRR2090159.bin1288]